MNVVRALRIHRRELMRGAELRYARFATWIAEAYPDFMCIGAPRAATTWLHTKLRADPRIFLPKRKELHFFDEEDVGPPDDDSGLRWYRHFYFDASDPVHLRWYWLQFRGAGNTIKGDITPLYSLLSRGRVSLIREKMPGLKVIYILRNPVDRAWSGLRKAVWYQQGRDRLAQRDAGWLTKAVMHPGVLERGNYRRALETWGDLFSESLLVLFYDDIQEAPAAELAKVYAFLNLEPPSALQAQPDNDARVNAAPALPIPAQIRRQLEDYYREQVRYLEDRFGRNLRHWIS